MVLLKIIVPWWVIPAVVKIYGVTQISSEAQFTKAIYLFLLNHKARNAIGLANTAANILPSPASNARFKRDAQKLSAGNLINMG